MAIEQPVSPPNHFVYDVPVAVDHNMESLYSAEALGQNVKDSKGFLLGPMPVSEFLRRFLKVDGLKDMPKDKNLKKIFSGVPDTQKNVSAEQIYEPLLKALSENDLCPGFVFRQASGPPSPARKLSRTKPRICCYAAEHLESIEGASATSRPELDHAELFIDISYTHPHSDYFSSSDHRAWDGSQELLGLGTDSEVLKEFHDMAWGPHISYVTEVFARQHRSFFFTVAFAGHYGRLFRWDRAGCIVTERFDIRTQPELLCDFLRRFSKMSRIARGHDATVVAATAEEEVAFRDAIAQHVKAQLGVEGAELEQAVAEHYLPGRVSAMHVLEQGSVATPKTVHRYLVSRPVISPQFLHGRGTRAFWAVDASTNQVAFLKDTWRFTGSHLEGDVLEEMNAKNVRNIPSLLCHGEVPDVLPIDRKRRPEFKEFQSTQTDEYGHEPWVRLVHKQAVSVAKLVHYRVVLGTVGYSLKHLKGTEELLHATFDVLHAMSDARNKVSRIHRDLSMGNIVLVAEEGRTSRRGYLIDWEASCEVDDTGASVHTDRPGTWEYMSLATMDQADAGKDNKQTLEDDMESLLYVIIHCGLLWLPHDLSDSELNATITMFFTARNVPLSDTAAIRQEAMARGIRPMEIGCGLKDWLFDLLDYFSGFEPPEDEGEDREPPAAGEGDGEPPKNTHEWTIENLEKFWEEFLRTHTLGQDDRVVHNHPRAIRALPPADDTTPPQLETAAAGPSDPTPSPSPSSIAKGKRRAEEPGPSGDPDAPAQPDQKRARREDAPSPSAKAPASVPLPHTSGRTSQVSSPLAARPEAKAAAPGPLPSSTSPDRPEDESSGHSDTDSPGADSGGKSPCTGRRKRRSGVAMKGGPTPILLSPRHASYASTLGKREAPEPLPESGPSPEREQKRFRLDDSGAGEIKLKSGVAAAASSGSA
ncbi:hypothetical protein OH76DRAFT_1410972 [Lentinus brumalis]|uniref:Fungal-type protein kinase domain-containing protein n=1 Tax=Lentinus brumalis TaxID=2498619 RepID=A0A371CQW4_9APHY|nr:hypothetical protein OH76DRAFT_1410972 [Polyporus brumalis]